jgi:hypothetical protein
VSQVYTELWAQVDGYAMDLRSLLLKEIRFDLGEKGRLRIDPPGIEERRRGIKRILSQLVDPRQFPAFPEAFRFDRAETWEERRHLIHRAASQLPDTAAEQPALADVSAWAASTWDFDRVMAYVAEERLPDPRSDEELTSLVRRARGELERARGELERARSRERNASAEPLDYALQALRAVIGRQPVADPVAEAARSLVKAVSDCVEADGRLEGAGSIKSSVAELQAALPEQQPQAATG